MFIAILLVIFAFTPALPQQSTIDLDMQAEKLRAIVSNSSQLQFDSSHIEVIPPQPDWQMGMVSWVAAGDGGLTYLLQRGQQADPIVVTDGKGRFVRSWGKGSYQTPHSIRIDPEGNVWTADAKSSKVMKYTPEGEQLLEILVGGQPPDCTGSFCGTSDVAFGPNGQVYVADGYRNARIIEYTAEGKKVREWGSAGEEPGQFRLPHSIAVNEGVIYVADRENGRIQRFTLDGHFLGVWSDYGKTFGLHVRNGAVWIVTQQRNEPNASPGWLMKIDHQSGELLGYLNVRGVHGIAVTDDGDVMVSPGPDNRPQKFKIIND